MKSINCATQRSIEGGWISGNVYCPICGRKVKYSLFQKLFWTRSRVEADAMSMHGLNAMYGRKIGH